LPDAIWSVTDAGSGFIVTGGFGGGLSQAVVINSRHSINIVEIVFMG
jgi:hypothetical protein